MKIKRYVLFVWDDCYPNGGWHDCMGDFDEITEVKKVIQCIVQHRNAKEELIPVYLWDNERWNHYELIDLETGKTI